MKYQLGARKMKIKNPIVARVFTEYPTVFRKKLLLIRKLILTAGKDNKLIGELQETLKWGEPSYLPINSNTGTTVRIHWLKSKPNQCGIYFNCQTTLVANFKKKYSDKFKFEGKRAIIFTKADQIHENELKDCIGTAFTYHLKKKRKT
jgi:hypothetical protein